jgi:hypothetical protein
LLAAGTAASALIAAAFGAAEAFGAGAGFGAGVFTAADLGAGILEPVDFNAFEGAFCDAVRVAPLVFFVAFLVDSLALAERLLVLCVFADFTDLARAAFCGAALGDFLRVFLDIRLPFVAFGGSIIGYCGSCPGEPESGRLLGKSDGLGVWLQGTRRTTVRWLTAPLGPDDA